MRARPVMCVSCAPRCSTATSSSCWSLGALAGSEKGIVYADGLFAVFRAVARSAMLTLSLCCAKLTLSLCCAGSYILILILATW